MPETAEPHRPVLSIVIPAFNEAGNVGALHERLGGVLAEMALEAEVIYVDDGSTDATLETLRGLATADPRIRVIALSRNFGHQIALTAGLDVARGEAVVCMDADLQHPPEVIPELVARWREGFDVVQAIRTDTPDAGWFKNLSAGAFYRLINWASDTPIRANAADFRLMSREALDALLQCRERDRFVRGLVAWIGFTCAEVPFAADERHSGKSKYSLGKMVRFAVDALTSFSTRPLRLATAAGLLAALLGVIYAGYIVYIRLLTESAVPGWASLTICVLILGGLQLICLGLIAEYIGRLLNEAKARPLYLVKPPRASEGAGDASQSGSTRGRCR